MSERPLTMPVSVYTAWHGYSWSSVPAGFLEKTLDHYGSKIGTCRPDFMSPCDYVEGVLYDMGVAVPFRVSNAEKWDAVGRDADYLVCAFVPREDLKLIDFNYLLSLSPFVSFDRPPPDSVVYVGPDSAECDVAAVKSICATCGADRFDFRSIGRTLVDFGAYCDSWLFCRTMSDGQLTTSVQTGTWSREPASWSASRKTVRMSSLAKLDAEAIAKMLKELS